MKKSNDHDHFNTLPKGKWLRTYLGKELPERKINTLLGHLLEAEEEVVTFKSRLKELEDAFYYNLEIISERDLELSVLEEKLNSENEFLQEVIQERNELKNLLKKNNDKNERKLQQLEKSLLLKEQELKDIQRDHEATLRVLVEGVKRQGEKKVQNICSRFEYQKKELIRNFQGQIEEKEQYYLLEIDKLEEKLAQAHQKNETLIKAEKESKLRLEGLKQVHLEKESEYLEALKRIQHSVNVKISKETQCDCKTQKFEKKIQAEAEMVPNCCQTDLDIYSSDEDYIGKINFLLEQNEVLKHIIKDLKRNRDTKSAPEFSGCECLTVRTEIDQIKQKCEIEINNLKKILEEELKEKAEEEVMIRSLEENVSTLKEKLLLGLQEKLIDFGVDDICFYTYSCEIRNEIQINLLERKFSKKMDSIISAVKEENEKLYKKLEELRKECSDKVEKYLKPQEETEIKSENFLAKIRSEIQKLENKIESDVKNLVRNNCEMNKCDKNFQTCVEHLEKNRIYVPEKQCQVLPEVPLKRSSNSFDRSIEPRWSYHRNDLSPLKCIGSAPISVTRRGRQVNIRGPQKKIFGEQRKLKKITNNSESKR